MFSILLISTSFATETILTDNTSSNEFTTGIQPTNSEVFHNGDLFVSEQNIIINDNVDGNVFAVAQNVTINSNITGDLFVLSSDLVISETAKIEGNVFIAAAKVNIKGNILRDVYTASEELKTEKNSQIGKSLNATANTIVLNGLINGNANLSVDDLNVNETSGSSIKGDLNYTSSNEGDFSKELVGGKINYNQTISETTKKVDYMSHIKDFVKTTIFTLIVLGILFWLMPNYIDKASYMLTNKPIRLILVGFLGLILIPILFIILLITILGIPVAFILIMLYIIAIMLASSILSIAIGKTIANKLNYTSKLQVTLFSLLSLVVLWFIKSIPSIGGFMAFIILLLGLGILVYGLFFKYNKDTVEV